MDAILKYLSVISVAGAAIGFVVGLWKYLDQRGREDRTRRFEIYHDLMRRVSAFGERGEEGLPLSQQLAAIYELQHFRDYSYASIPILTHLRQHYEARGDSAPPVLLAALDATLHALSASDASALSVSPTASATNRLQS